MFADPLRDIGLGRPRTLLQRALPGELEMLLLAQIGLRDPANHHDYLNKSHDRSVNQGFSRHGATHKLVPKRQKIIRNPETGDSAASASGTGA
jgi:hypothetical protein